MSSTCGEPGNCSSTRRQIHAAPSVETAIVPAPGSSPSRVAVEPHPAAKSVLSAIRAKANRAAGAGNVRSAHRSVSAGRGVGGLGEPPDAPGLRRLVGVGPEHRQRGGRRGDRAMGEPADEAFRGRWRVENVGPFAELLALADTPDWEGVATIRGGFDPGRVRFDSAVESSNRTQLLAALSTYRGSDDSGLIPMEGGVDMRRNRNQTRRRDRTPRIVATPGLGRPLYPRLRPW